MTNRTIWRTLCDINIHIFTHIYIYMSILNISLEFLLIILSRLGNPLGESMGNMDGCISSMVIIRHMSDIALLYLIISHSLIRKWQVYINENDGV
jgi:hypothetical protein